MFRLVNRHTIMFTLGAAGFLHELLGTAPERPFLLGLSGALMGLPFVLSADQRFSRTPDDVRETQQGSEKKEDRWSHLP